MIKKHRVIRYIISGIIAVILNLLILYTFVDIFHLWYLMSSIIAFCCGIVVSYSLQKFFTFQNNSKNGVPLQFSIFLIYNICMLGLNTLLMYVLVDKFGFWYFFSQIMTTTCTAFINYTFFSKVLFKNK
jgi:dolichol-phosphate mannosyltransferase